MQTIPDGDMLLTIAVAVYNVEESLLHRCLCSLLPATRLCSEIILVDDGSTDNCPKILDAFASECEIAHVIHTRNQGLSGARNVGLDNACGSWVMFVDGDDYIPNGFLDQVPSLLAGAGECDILFFGYKDSWDRSAAIEQFVGNGAFSAAPESFALAKSIVGNNEFQFGYEGSVKFCASWGKFFRRRFIEEHACRFTLGVNKSQDRVFMTEVLSYRPQLRIADMLGYVYVCNPSSVTRRHDEGMAGKLAHTYEVTEQKVRELYYGRELDEMLEALVQMRCVFMYDALDASYLSPTGNPSFYHEFKQFRQFVQEYLDCIDATDLRLIYGVRNKYLIGCLKHRLYRAAYYGSTVMMDAYLRLHR